MRLFKISRSYDAQMKEVFESVNCALSASDIKVICEALKKSNFTDPVSVSSQESILFNLQNLI